MKAENQESMSVVDRFALFFTLLGRNFVRHNGTQNAAALTYTTLLSLVPMMTVFLAVFSAFPVADKVSVLIQDFVFENFVPTSGEVLQEYLEEFASKASKLTGIGFAFLLVVAVMMMSNINRALNSIWEATAKRKWASQFLIYWAILSLGPILIGVSVVATSYLVSIPILQEATSVEIKKGMISVMPILSSSLAFGLIYLVVPNRSVSIRHALAGGVFAAVLFELAKRAFAFYVTNFPTYEAIYGALATIPVFLIWVYVSWMIVLFGAEFTYSMGVYRTHIKRDIHNRSTLVDVVQLLVTLGQAQQKGETCTIKQLLSVDLAWTELQLEQLLLELQSQRLVLCTEEGEWALSRSLSEVYLYELYKGGQFRLPTVNEAADGPLKKIFKQGHEALEQILGVSVVELMEKEEITENDENN